MKSLFVILVLVVSTCQIYAQSQVWIDMKKYVDNSPEVVNYDNSMFTTMGIPGRSKETAAKLRINGRKVTLNAKDTIPGVVFREFRQKRTDKSYFLYTTEGKTKGSTTDNWIIYREDRYYFVLCHRHINNFMTEFIILSSKDEEYASTYVTLVLYDEKNDYVVNDILLLYSECGILKKDWNDPEKRLGYGEEYEETVAVEKGVFKQYYVYGCTPDDVPGTQLSCRHIVYNQRYRKYEEIWNESKYVIDSKGDSVLIYTPMASKCVIKDKDGYTNVRKEPNRDSEILYRINEGEEFVINNEEINGWYRVVNYNDKEHWGWIHKSRVQILKEPLEEYYRLPKYTIQDLKEHGQTYWFDLKDM